MWNTGDYFQSYEDLQIHRLMLEDRVRNEAYKKAIFDNRDMLKDKTILDVGAGTGILSVFCAQAGAAKVYAVEASETYKIAEEIVKENGFENIIEVVHSKIENFVLPGDTKVDAIVSEWMGFYLLHEGMLDSVIYARDNFLKKDGLMFPESATLYVAPCSLPNLFDKWEDIEGVSMKALGKALRIESSKKPETSVINSADILSLPETLSWLDLNTVTCEELNEIKSNLLFSASKPGKYQGIALWFTCTFPSHKTEPIILSTDPDDDQTHWKQTIVVLPDEIIVEVNEPMAVGIVLSRSTDNLRRYNIEVTMLDPGEIEHPEYCSCYYTKCILSKAVIQNYEKNNMNE